MGLSVLLLNVIVPEEEFDTHEKIEECCEKNNCDFHFVDNCPAILKTKFVKDVVVDMLDLEETCKLFKIDMNKYDFLGQMGSNYVFLDKSYTYTENGTPEDFERQSICITADTCIYKPTATKGFFAGEIVASICGVVNRQFYLHGKWDNDTVVVDKETLIDDWKKYFSDDGERRLQQFKENIIDKFVEGKHIVAYW